MREALAAFGVHADQFVRHALDRVGWRRLIHGVWGDPRKVDAKKPPPPIIFENETYNCTACERTFDTSRRATRHWSSVHIRDAVWAAQAAMRDPPTDAPT